MKKHLLRLSMIAALAASASFAETYYFNVPFNFVVENRAVTAGQYVLDSSAVSGALLLRSDDQKSILTVAGASMTSENGGQTGRLVFHRYGNRYFLEQVWTRGGAGHQLRQSAEERELVAQGESPASKNIALR
jgi:hypothetical protein